MARVKRVWLNGPYQFDEEGRLVTAGGPQLANPALRCWAQRGERLRAVRDLKRSQNDRAAAIKTSVNLPTWGHVAAVVRSFQERGVAASLAMAKADHSEAYKQLPVRNDRRILADLTLEGPESDELRGSVPQAQLFGATEAVSRYSAVSQGMATAAVRWLKLPRLGYFDDFGVTRRPQSPQCRMRFGLSQL